MVSWIDILLIGFFFAALVSGRVPMSAAFLALIASVLVAQRLDAKEVIAKIGEPALIGILCLVLFSHALGRLTWLNHAMIGHRPDGPSAVLARFLAVAGVISSIAPNTAVVGAFLSPAVKQKKVAAGLLLLPLSYIALAGGMVTQIGTSTNIIVVAKAQQAGIAVGFVDFFIPGIFVLISVFLVLLIAAPRLLKSSPMTSDRTMEGFHVQAEVAEASPLVGRTIGENGLRNLHGFYLAEIERHGRLIAPVSPEDIVEEGDTLIFVGDATLIDSLSRFPGLRISSASYQHFHGRLYQAVIAPGSLLVGRTLKTAGFRARFDASVLAIRRGDEPLSGKLGSIVLKAGDLLLLASGPDFNTRENLRNNFILVENNDLGGWNFTPRTGLLISLTFLAFIGSTLSGLIPFELGSFLLIVLAVGARWIEPRDIRRLFPFDLMICLWGSLVLGMLIEKSALDLLFASFISDAAKGFGPIAVLILFYVATWVLTELLSNISAALAMLPVGLKLAAIVSAPPEAFVLACAFGASASFIVPFGYQTHLMILGPGGYTFWDFFRLGGIVNIVYGTVALIAISLVWLQ